jgi:superfamily II DNA or RNA helicase
MSSKRTPCYIRIDDEVNCLVSGLHPTDENKLYNQYGLFAPNHFFNPRFKLGIWDGKLRFFQKSGQTLVYLLDELLPQLIKLGYSPKITDLRKGPYVDAQPITKDVFSHVLKGGNPMELRYYQVDAVNALIADGKGMIEASTSAGKTWINAALVDAYGKCGLKTITIVPSTSLVIQTIKDFRDAGMDVGEYTGKTKDLEHTHVISTWQAIKNHPEIMQRFQVVVVDEVHGAKGKVLNDLVNVHGAKIPYRFGLTGTLPKDPVERLTIHNAFSDVKYTIPAHELQEQNFISSVNITIAQLFENHPKGYFPDFTAEKSYLQLKRERLDWIADKVIEKAALPKGNAMVLVSSVGIGKKLQKLIPNSIFLHGTDSAEDRKKVYDLFETNDNMIVIATVQIAGTGLSIDRIFNLFLIDIGKSFTRVIQAIGRGLRKNSSDKDHVNVFDVCSNLKYSNNHLLMRIQYYKDAKYPFTKTVVRYRDYDDAFDDTQDALMKQIESETTLDY